MSQKQNLVICGSMRKDGKTLSEVCMAISEEQLNDPDTLRFKTKMVIMRAKLKYAKKHDEWPDSYYTLSRVRQKKGGRGQSTSSRAQKSQKR